MTCTEARSLLKGAWTASAGLAFERHFVRCPACHDFVAEIVGHIPEEERRAQAEEFARTLAPLMVEAILNDPEV